MLNHWSVRQSLVCLLAAVAFPVMAQQAASLPPTAAAPPPKTGIQQASKPVTNAPAVKRIGVGIPGEIAFSTASLEATWQSYRGKLLLFSLIDKREDLPMLISQDVFTLVLADGQPIRSSRMEASPAVVTVVKTNAKASAAFNRAAGRQAAVTLMDPDGRFKATWKAIQREGTDYLRQEITLEALGKPLTIEEIRLVDLNKDGFRPAGPVAGGPAKSDTLFAGVENPLSTNSISGANVKSMLVSKVTLQPGVKFHIGSVIGAFAIGQFEEAFKAYRDRENAVLEDANPVDKRDKASKQKVAAQPEAAPKAKSVKSVQPTPVQQTKTPTTEPRKPVAGLDQAVPLR